MTAPPRGSGRPGGTADQPAIFFADAGEFRAWMEANHDTATELWMGLNGKHVTPRGLTWAEAVPEALCFGWIDSKSEGIDADRRRQRWTPRRPGSTWSRTNVAHVERLLAEGRMHPAGRTAYEARRPDRTGTYSFEQESAELTPEQRAALEDNAEALAFWTAATPSYRKVCAHWVNGAKQQATRDQRLAQLVEDSALARRVPFQRHRGQPAWVRRHREARGLPTDEEEQ